MNEKHVTPGTAWDPLMPCSIFEDMAFVVFILKDRTALQCSKGNKSREHVLQVTINNYFHLTWTGPNKNGGEIRVTVV